MEKKHKSEESEKENEIDGQKLVPLRWVFASYGIAIGCVGTVFIGAITIGAWTTRVSLGQEAQNQRISLIEGDRSIRIREGETFQRETLTRLTSMETKLNILLDRK